MQPSWRSTPTPQPRARRRRRRARCPRAARLRPRGGNLDELQFGAQVRRRSSRSPLAARPKYANPTPPSRPTPERTIATGETPWLAGAGAGASTVGAATGFGARRAVTSRSFWLSATITLLLDWGIAGMFEAHDVLAGFSEVAEPSTGRARACRRSLTFASVTSAPSAHSNGEQTTRVSGSRPARATRHSTFAR